MANKLKKLRSKTSIGMASSAAVLAGALFAANVYAQEDTDTQETETQEAQEAEAGSELEEVVVFGIKQSLQNAQDIKRDASTVVDVITASDITALPDSSVVDALARVPGVTIEVFEATDDPEHFGAEGSTALVRGLNRTITQFNGRTSFSATQWGALNLSHIPSELVGSIEVQKNQTASMIEGGIAGTLNLITRKPFDNPGMVFGGSLAAEYGDVVEDTYPSVSALFSNRWETDIGEIGWLISVNASELRAKSQGVGVHDFYEQCNLTNFNSILSGQRPSCPSEVGYLSGSELTELRDAANQILLDAQEADPDVTELNASQIAQALNEVGISADGIANQFGTTDSLWLPPSLQFREKEDTRERFGVTTSLQWANPDETIQATLEFIHSKGSLVWSEYLIQNKDSLGRQLANASGTTLLEVPGYSGVNESFGSDGLFTHGILSLNAGRGYEAQTRHHDEETHVNDVSLDVEFILTDNLTLNTDLHYVDSGQKMFDHTIHNQFDSDVWLDIRDEEAPQIGFVGDNFGQLTAGQAAYTTGTLIQDTNGNYWGGDTGSITDPNRVYLRSAMDHDTDSSGDALAFSADFDYAVDDSWITNIKAGVRFSKREQLHKSADYDWGVIAPEWSAEDRRTAADYMQFQQVVDFGSDFHGGDAFINGSVTSFYLPQLRWAKDLSAFEEEYRSTVPNEYRPDADADNEGPDDDATFYLTREENDTADVFETLERQNIEGKAPGSPFAPYRIYDIEETSNAAYVQVDFDFMDWPMPVRGNIGLRYVDIDVVSKGYRRFEDTEGSWLDATRYVGPENDDPDYANIPDTVIKSELDSRPFPEDMLATIAAVRSGVDSETAIENNILFQDGYTEILEAEPEPYSEVLPSFNVVVNLQDDLLLRFGASKAIYIPHLSLKRTSQVLDTSVNVEQYEAADFDGGVWPTADGEAPDNTPFKQVEFSTRTSSTVGSSNPYLLPEESINVDLSLEWYFADVGSVSGVLFRKDMDNLIRRSTFRADVEHPVTGYVAEDVLHLNTFDNVGTAEINGIELSYQQTYDMLPGFWSGLGVQLNYTYLDTTEDVETGIDTTVFGTFVDLPLQGLSEENYNLIVFYENELFSTRLAYNFRSEYMLNDRDVIGDRPVYNADRATLDFSFNYNVTDAIKVNFAVTNLTDEQTRTSFQYNSVGSLSARNYFVNDRRIRLGVSGSF